MYSEEEAWKHVDVDDMWIFDKLILARKLGHVAGPVGMDVPNPDCYCVRPVVNALGYGLKAERLFILKSTDDLGVGNFWCEWFDGQHLSVDYHNGKQVLSVVGVKAGHHKFDLQKFSHWVKVDETPTVPPVLSDIINKYEYVNVEYIGGNPIEVHLRHNPDFKWGNSIYKPWYDIPKEYVVAYYESRGYRYIRDPGYNERHGAFIK